MKELVNIQRDLKAPKGQFNNFGKYKYRSCEDILEGLKEHLSSNECTLTISDDVRLVGDRYYIEATVTLTNKEGASIVTKAMARESLSKKGMDDSQITGTASSYARKYALNGLFAIDDTKDADTMKPVKQAPAPTKKQLFVKWAKSNPYVLEIIKNMGFESPETVPENKYSEIKELKQKDKK